MTRRDHYEGASPYSVIDHDLYWRGLIADFSGEHAFLSNFWPWDGTRYVEPPFEVKGKLVKTAEHAYQAQKTLVPSLRDGILAADTPGLAKRRGRQATLRPEWESIKVQVMREILRWKFPSAQNFKGAHPRSVALLETGGFHLVEGNTWGDTFWGCVHPTEKSNLWVGTNWLGILLMERRKQLQEEIPY